MSTPRIVVILLVICGLTVFILQNPSPAIALVIFGLSTAPLPLAAWLGIAIALGGLTSLILNGLLNAPGHRPKRSSRRRWRVAPEPPLDPLADRPSASSAAPPEPPPKTSSRASTPPFTGQTAPSPSTPRDRPAPPDPNRADDWQAWGQRTPASQWDDWTQAEQAEASRPRGSRQQRKAQETVETAMNALDQGWDNTAQDTVYVAPGGSDVDDALDDIADGWDDWETDHHSPADTAYAYRYPEPGASPRVDAVRAPADDDLGAYEDWHGPPPGTNSDEDWGLEPEADSDNPYWPQQDRADAATGSEADDDEGVYDADYRVIIPPSHPLDQENSDRDRTPDV